MIKFNSVGQIEKIYCFEKAVADEAVLNGAFGVVEDGKFSVAANELKAVMQIEVGDDMYMDDYKIPAKTPLRVVDLAEVAKQYPMNPVVEVYDRELASKVAVGDMLVSDANGKLVAGGAAPCLEVKKIIGNKLGVEVAIVLE